MPVYDLPPEILGLVFEQGLAPYTDFDASAHYKRRELLSSIRIVCAQWNDIACQTPSLWTLVRVDYDLDIQPDPKFQAEVHMAQVERAGNRPLNIILARDSKHRRQPALINREEFWRFWKFLAKKSDQWRSLCIDQVHIHTTTKLSALFPSNLPNLVDLSSEVTANAGMPSIVSAPALRRYEQRSAFVPFSSTGGLEQIDVQAPFGQALPLLRKSTSLETLHLNRVTFYDPDPSEPILLPSLRQVIITGGWSETFQNIFSTVLAAPAVHTLHIKALPFVDPSVPLPVALLSLATIRFDNADVFELRAIRAFLGELRNLSSVTVILPAIAVSYPEQLIKPEALDIVGKQVRRIEAIVSKLVWEEGRGTVEEPFCFRTWDEVRGRLGGLRHY